MGYHYNFTFNEIVQLRPLGNPSRSRMIVIRQQKKYSSTKQNRRESNKETSTTFIDVNYDVNVFFSVLQESGGGIKISC